jgi:hypothetical protein
VANVEALEEQPDQQIAAFQEKRKKKTFHQLVRSPEQSCQPFMTSR